MIAKNYVVAICITFLAGCATAPDTLIVNRPVAVSVPVAVFCKVVAPEVPTWALNGVSAESDLYTKGRAMVAELQQRIAYESELLAAVAACQ